MELFHPAYYRSISARLYNFDGKEVIPESTTVISYEDKVDANGKALGVSLVTLVVLVALAIPFTSWAGLVSYGWHILLLGEAGSLIY
jgi:hypothetical protein